MGERDIQELTDINKEIKKITKKHKLPFKFETDKGQYQTAIEFFFLGNAKTPQWEVIHPPRSKNWDSNPTILCPDLLDFKHKLLVEYEEEGQKSRPGAHLATKGHGREGDFTTTRDTRRDEYYKWGGFRVLKFYEIDLEEQNWTKLYEFLSEHVEQ